MTAATALRLARPRAGRRIIAAAVAVAGTLLIFVAHLAIVRDDWNVGLAAYVTESGLRPGTMTGALLLAVPVVALALQALRMGSVDRDRRLATLRLAGLTPGELRMVSAIEAGRAAAVGTLLAGPGYLLLWVVAGVLPPWGARVVPVPGVVDVALWLLLIPALTAAAGAAAALLGERHACAGRPGRANRAALVVGGALVVLPLVSVGLFASGSFPFLVIVGLVVLAFASGPWLVLGAARFLARRPGAEPLLAARHLRVDPRSTGRVAGVLIVCGVALSIEALLVYQLLAEPGRSDDGFYVAGFSTAGVAMLCGAAVAIVTLVLGTADSLLAARRPLAALSVFGVDEAAVARVVRRQLLATAVPATVIGAVTGGGALIALYTALEPEAFPAVGFALLLGAGVALVTGLLLALVTWAAVRLLRPLIRSAIDPENLRAA